MDDHGRVLVYIREDLYKDLVQMALWTLITSNNAAVHVIPVSNTKHVVNSSARGI